MEQSKLKKIVITGSNQGLGLQMVKTLASTLKFEIIMACRNLQFANQSAKKVKEANPEAVIKVERLDLSSQQSIRQFAKTIHQKYGTIDILMNNAGILKFVEEVKKQNVDDIFRTNYWGVIELTSQMIPLIAEHGKIIFMGSSLGKLWRVKSQDTKKILMSQDLDEKQLIQIMKDFQEKVVYDIEDIACLGRYIYGLSKVGINIYPKILMKNPVIIQKDIQCYSCCPGFCSTNLNNFTGVLTAQEGIKTPLQLVDLPDKIDEKLQGKFFFKQQIQPLDAPFQHPTQKI